MPNILIENNFYQGTSQACIIDLTPPTFAGITFLDVESRGQIRSGWSAATDATAPIRYEVYIKASTATGLFSTTNIIAVTPNLQYDIFTLPDGSFLANGTTYYVGVRAIDGVNNRDSNTVSMSVISTGVLTAIDVYENKMSYSIDTSNQFRMVMWCNKNESLAVSPNGVLGTASYQIYDKTGATVAMSQSGIAANGQGQYVITPIASILDLNNNNYTVKVTINVDSENRVNFLELEQDMPEYKLGGLFFVNNSNNFDGSFWVSADEGLKTTNLGTGSYQVYDHDGVAVVGMNASGITPSVDGIYVIAAVANLLTGEYPGYSVKVSLTVDGKVKTQMLGVTAERNVYTPKAQFSINALNQLQGSFWVQNIENGIQLTGLGTANYTVYDSSGAVVSGLTQSGITADVNGRFHITPVSATLLTDLTHYNVKIGVVVHGIERISYKGFSLLGT